MRRSLLLIAFVALPVVAQAQHGAPQAGRDCRKTSPEFLDSITVLARRLHPEALARELKSGEACIV